MLLVVEATMETVSDIDKCVSLRNLVPFEQFQKREKHPWRSVTFSNFKGFSLELYEKYHSSICIFPVFKLYKWHQIAQRITNNFGLQVWTFKRPWYIFSTSRLTSFRTHSNVYNGTFSDNLNLIKKLHLRCLAGFQMRLCP